MISKYISVVSGGCNWGDRRKTNPLHRNCIRVACFSLLCYGQNKIQLWNNGLENMKQNACSQNSKSKRKKKISKSCLKWYKTPENLVWYIYSDCGRVMLFLEEHCFPYWYEQVKFRFSLFYMWNLQAAIQAIVFTSSVTMERMNRELKLWKEERWRMEENWR